jgi:hypothetical protein
MLSLVVEVRSSSSPRTLRFSKDPLFGEPVVEAQGRWVLVSDFDVETRDALVSIMRDHPMMREWVR